MKSSFPTSAQSRILLAAFCLLFLSPYAICQSVTRTPAKSEAVAPALNIPEIVRDLKLCDAIKLERDILTAYNSSLTTQLNGEIKRRIEAENDRNKYKLKTNRQGRTIIILVGVVIVQTAIQIIR